MEKVYVISWARALGGDGMPVDASAGSDGVYINREQALKALTFTAWKTTAKSHFSAL